MRSEDIRFWHIWIGPSSENAGRLMLAITEFGMPLIDVIRLDFESDAILGGSFRGRHGNRHAELR